jgi:hypothetical protein
VICDTAALNKKKSKASLVSKIEELLESNNCGSGLENREYGREDPSR